MSDKLLRKNDIAAMLQTSPDVAASVLREYGYYPIFFGRGKSRGYRWLESAVNDALLAMNERSKPKDKKNCEKKSLQRGRSLFLKPLSEMKASELFNFIQNSELPKGQIVQ